jgi:hypothetical protein
MILPNHGRSVIHSSCCFTSYEIQALAHRVTGLVTVTEQVTVSAHYYSAPSKDPTLWILHVGVAHRMRKS